MHANFSIIYRIYKLGALGKMRQVCKIEKNRHVMQIKGVNYNDDRCYRDKHRDYRDALELR